MSTPTDQQLAEWRVDCDRIRVSPDVAVSRLIDALIAERARSRELHAALRGVAFRGIADARWCALCGAPLEMEGEFWSEKHAPTCLAAPAEEVSL